MPTPIPGELMMVGFDGAEVTQSITDWITKRHVGGVVLFSRNMRNMPQLSRLISDLQRLRAQVSSQPLFIAVDQEGGVVSRMIPGISLLPGNMALGSIGTNDSAFAAGRIIATEMSMLGCNVNFAPVVDHGGDPKNLIVGVRAFGEDPNLIGRLAAAMVQGLQENGMLATLKHFPGLGRCHSDPHFDLPSIPFDLNMLTRELAPFNAGIQAGARMVMSAHAVYPGWDKDQKLPATFSRTIMHGLLREELGFEGLVVSDDVEMQALTSHYTSKDIAANCIDAGIDILTVCHTQARQMEIYEALRQLSRGGAVAKMKQSLSRIQTVKKEMLEQQSRNAVDVATLSAHHQIVDRMGRESISVVHDKTGQLPVRAGRNDSILCIVPRYEAQTLVEEALEEKDQDEKSYLLNEMRVYHPSTQMMKIALNPTARDRERLATIRAHDLVILCTYNAHLFPGQAQYAKQVLKLKKEVIVVALRNPYDLSILNEAHTLIATYGFRQCSLKGLVQVLFGEISAKGEMPVSL